MAREIVTPEGNGADVTRSLYIIDGHYQIFRAFYAPFRDLSSPAGEPTRATHVFCQMLAGLLRDRRPDYLAIVMDVSDKTVFRRQIDPDYKSHRDEPPADFDVQAARIVQIIEAVGIPIFRVPGFEADDVAATIVEQLKSEDVMCYLVSRDKDLDQVLSEKVHLFDPARNEIIDPDRLFEIKGFRPDQAVDVQMLVGDTTDNVPGARGVGPKTAVKLINQYGSVDAVLAHAGDLTPKLAESLRAFAPLADRTRQLVTLRRDVPVAFSLDSCAASTFNLAAALPIFEELGFNTLLQNWAQLAGKGGISNTVASFAPGNADSPPPAPGLLFSLSEDSPRERYELTDTPEALNALADELSCQRAFAFDTETTGINPIDADLVGLSIAFAPGRAFYIPVRSMVGRSLPEALVAEKLRGPFEDAAIRKVGHHLKFDMQMLRRIGIEVRGELFDTMVASFLLDPLRASHGLDNLVRGLLGHTMIPITDLIGKGRQEITMDHVDTRRVCEYAAEDADYTWRLFELFDRKLKNHHAERLFHETEMPLVEVLADMEQAGIAIDCRKLAELSGQMQQQLDDLRRHVFDLVGHPFNLDSPKQLAEVLFDELKLPVVRRTRTGRSTDAETLETLRDQTNHPVTERLLQYREIFKLKSTYVDTLPAMVSPRTGRIHASFHQTGAVTGRLSSSDPNLQNIPIRTPLGKRIREAFVAGRPDTVLVSADYSQIELRMLAHFCQDRALLEAFERGEDIHRFVAAQVNGVSLDQVTPEQRAAAKAVNFGIIYGQTAFGLARALGITQTAAKSFIDRYFARYPGIRKFIDDTVARARRDGYVETILGRRRPVRELESRNRQQAAFGERIAVNTVIQGSAADLIKRAMVDIHRELKRRAMVAERKNDIDDAPRTRLLLQVHDELVFEAAEADVARDAELIREKMARAIPLNVPIGVDIGWARNWLAAK